MNVTEDQTDALRRQLEARARGLADEIRTLDDDPAEIPLGQPGQPVEDVADQGERLSRALVRDAERTRDIVELRDVEAALARMDTGAYGECIDCGARIKLQRLQALPSASRCLPCQQRYETATAAS